MTKTTEELKREMYDQLAATKFYGRNYFPGFETCLETYLEALRQDSMRASIEQDDLSIRLANMTTDRDEIRNKLQAFEFANKSAGEFLQEAQAKVKRQRQSIGQLKNDRNNARSLAAVNYEKYQKARKEASELRKQMGATRIQNEKENVADEELKRFDEPSIALACSRCKGSGMESNANGQWTASCFKCATGFGVLKS